MNQQKSPYANLDDLVTGKLPERIVNSINQTELTIEELEQWAKSRPAFHLSIGKSRLVFECRIDISIKKALAWFVATTSSIWILIKFIVYYVSPALSWLQKLLSS